MKKITIKVCIVLCISMLLPLQSFALFDRYGSLHHSDVITNRTYSINSSDNGHNKELKLANNVYDSKNWLYYSAEDVCDGRDLTLIGFDDLPNMDNCECALFFVCHSAEGAYDDVNASNFLSQAVDECGVSYAIGFDGNASCQYCTCFLDSFELKISNGFSIIESFLNSYAIDNIDYSVYSDSIDTIVFRSSYYQYSYNNVRGEFNRNYH